MHVIMILSNLHWASVRTGLWQLVRWMYSNWTLFWRVLIISLLFLNFFPSELLPSWKSRVGRRSACRNTAVGAHSSCEVWPGQRWQATSVDCLSCQSLLPPQEKSDHAGDHSSPDPLWEGRRCLRSKWLHTANNKKNMRPRAIILNFSSWGKSVYWTVHSLRKWP